MVSQKKGNPSERVNLAEGTQRGLGETGKNPVLISHWIVRQRTVINVSQNHENMMLTFLGACGAITSAHAHPKMGAFFLLFWGSK